MQPNPRSGKIPFEARQTAAGTLEVTEDDDDLPHLGEMVGRPCRMWLNNNALPVPDPNLIDVTSGTGADHAPPTMVQSADDDVEPELESHELSLRGDATGMVLDSDGAMSGFSRDCGCDIQNCQYSAAEQAGVLPGWQLLEIDGTPFSDYCQAVADQPTGGAPRIYKFLAPKAQVPAKPIDGATSSSLFRPTPLVQI